jgi:F-type H+-transporting ATPase subunit epsilon
MSEEFKVEIVNPEKSFLSKEDVTEVVIPAFEGEMGILKDHISIISFLKPGIIKIFSKNKEEKFYVEDGIVEFKDNSLSVLTSSIFSLDKIDKNYVNESIQNAEKELSDENIEDQRRFLVSQKIDVLKSINSN